MRIIDADALIERLKKDSPDSEGVDEWIDIINDECRVQHQKGSNSEYLGGELYEGEFESR